MIDSSIGRDITGFVGTMELDGKVAGNVEIEVDNLTIGSNASIDGNLVYTSETEAVIASGATIAGSTTRNIPETPQPKLFELKELLA